MNNRRILFKKFFFLVMGGVVSLFFIVLLAIIFYNPSNHRIANSRLIVILGAGYQRDGEPVLALERRLEKAIEIYHNIARKNRYNAPYFMISGRVEEVDVMNRFLLNHQINPLNIIKDIKGINTRATVLNTKELSFKLDTNPIFVSQAYHLPRIWIYTQYYDLSKSQYIASDRVALPFFQMFPIAFRETSAIFLFSLYALYDLI